MGFNSAFKGLMALTVGVLWFAQTQHVEKMWSCWC